MQYQYKQLCSVPTREMIDDTETMMRVVQRRQYHDQLEDVDTLMRVVQRSRPVQTCTKVAEEVVEEVADAMYEFENGPIFQIATVAILLSVLVGSIVGLLV